jgi:hypothetical protein
MQASHPRRALRVALTPLLFCGLEADEGVSKEIGALIYLSSFSLVNKSVNEFS